MAGWQWADDARAGHCRRQTAPGRGQSSSVLAGDQEAVSRLPSWRRGGRRLLRVARGPRKAMEEKKLSVVYDHQSSVPGNDKPLFPCMITNQVFLETVGVYSPRTAVTTRDPRAVPQELLVRNRQTLFLRITFLIQYLTT